MENRGIDGLVTRPKNRRVLQIDERIRLGIDLRRRRKSLGLDQKDIAPKAEMSIGTVQNIEYGKDKVGRDKIAAYAKVVGTTVEDILNPEAAQPTDHKERGLNREHLEIARLYRDAYKSVRAAVEMLLPNDPAAADAMTALAALLLDIKQAVDRDQAMLDAIAVLLEFGGLTVTLARRLDADPEVEAAIRDAIANKPK